MASTYTMVGYGSQGESVRRLQSELNKQGYQLDEDGVFGEKTRAAVRDYQKKNSLKRDGIAGDETWGSLMSASASAAALRAIHVFDENRRAAAEAEALQKGDFPAFLALVNASGASSWQYLQNVTSGDPRQQALAVTLAVCRRALGGQGAVRVHGGGFAGTALAFVPDDRREMFRRTVEQTLGTDKCRLLSVRNPLAHSGRYC